MKIKSLRISNILSFKHYDDILDAPEIKFNDGVNILIGQNGSGKSTALEVINFVIKKVLFTYYFFNRNLYNQKDALGDSDRKRTIHLSSENEYKNFRLDPNWNSEEKPQIIRIEIELDGIDKNNLKILSKNYTALQTVAGKFTELNFAEVSTIAGSYVFQISLDKNSNKRFAYTIDTNDSGSEYLTKYNFYKELISLYNAENPTKPIPQLYEPFSFISGYRNYNAFNPTVSLRDSDALQQIQGITSTDFNRSLNTLESAEPAIFSLVRLRLAGIHYEQFGDKTAEDVEKLVNKQDFLLKINDKLKLVNLKVEIKLSDKRMWAYSFAFIDIKRNKALTDINSLSAGQKSIIHLIFESYGRGELKGGVVVIDEPEIHLHYQFQHEYLRIVEELQGEQNSQYIIVTHSESLINSKTINQVKRFALDSNDNSWVASPSVSGDQKTLIKILDNTRSTYAFFARKVLLVEGDTDRYFFKAVLSQLRPDLNQEIAVLDIGGKGNYENWKVFFESFGLKVYFIGDFDNVFSLKISGAPLVGKVDKVAIEDDLRQAKLDASTKKELADLKKFYDALVGTSTFLTKPQRKPWKSLLDKFNSLIRISLPEIVAETKTRVTTMDTQIDGQYSQNIFILKKGSIEVYIGTAHGDIAQVIAFCSTKLNTWMSGTGAEVTEIKTIINRVTS